MLASPQTITIATVDSDVHKVTGDSTSSTYKTLDGTLSFKVSHQESKSRTRRMCRIDQKVIAADPLTAVNQEQSAGVYLVIDEPIFGFTNDEITDLVDALKTWLSAANVTAVLGSRH